MPPKGHAEHINPHMSLYNTMIILFGPVNLVGVEILRIPPALPMPKLPEMELSMCLALMKTASVVRVLGYRSRGPGSILGSTRKEKVVGLERGPLSLVSTTEEILDRKVAALV
jgi:hypothetical protein